MIHLQHYLSAEALQALKDKLVQRAFNNRTPQQKQFYGFVYIIFCILVGIFAASYLLTSLDNASRYMLYAALLLLLVSLAWIWWWNKNNGYAKWLAASAGDYEWRINDEGLRVSLATGQTFYAWPNIVALEEDDEYWYLYVRQALAIALPKAATVLSGNADIAAQIQHYWQAHPNNFNETLTHTSKDLFGVAYLRKLASNLKAGAKLAFFRPLNYLAFKVSVGQILGLIALELLLYISNDYWGISGSAAFNIYGLTEYAADFALFLLAAIFIINLIAARYWLLRFLVMVLASTLAIQFIYVLVNSSLWRVDGYTDSSAHWAVWMLVITWLALAVARSLRLLFKLPMPSTLYLVSLFVLLAYVAPAALTEQRFFTEDYSQESAAEAELTPEINVEDAFYKQQDLVANAVENLTPQRENKTDLFFIGFAGQANEKVFANEVNFTKKLFDDKYDTLGHSIALINSEATLETTPMANQHNLAAALNGVAKRMNVEEDILFLFLTSHGSKEFDLSVSFWPMTLNDLPAANLKKILDESGIKNRVIVVSACYSGGFIDALKNDNTLILTASRKDRASFGCGTESEYTYFSEALFVQSLKQRQPFTQAFAEAKKIVSAREKIEQIGQDPSLPQMYEGVAIKAKLTAWYQDLVAAK